MYNCRYVNHLCELADSSFDCSLCGRTTELKHLTLWHSQYCRYPAARAHLPELTQQVFEVVVDPELQGTGMFGQHSAQEQQVRAQGKGSLRGMHVLTQRACGGCTHSLPLIATWGSSNAATGSKTASRCATFLA